VKDNNASYLQDYFDSLKSEPEYENLAFSDQVRLQHRKFTNQVPTVPYGSTSLSPQNELEVPAETTNKLKIKVPHFK
jgi:hypothetical protein